MHEYTHTFTYMYRNNKGFPGGSVVENPPAKAGNPGRSLIQGSRRKWQPTPVILLGNPTDRAALQSILSMGSQKSWT